MNLTRKGTKKNAYIQIKLIFAKKKCVYLLMFHRDGIDRYPLFFVFAILIIEEYGG